MSYYLKITEIGYQFQKGKSETVIRKHNGGVVLILDMRRKIFVQTTAGQTSIICHISLLNFQLYP